MKPIFLGILLVLSNLMFAQTFTETDSVLIPFETQIEHIFEYVDLSEVTASNGMLIDYGIPIFAIECFDGTLNDTNIANIDIFGLAYATLSSTAVDSIYRLPAPSAYRNIIDTVSMDENVIPIALLHQQYFSLDTNSITDNLFTVTDGQLHDVPSRSRSPYLIHDCFIVSPVVDRINSNILTLSFDSDLFFNNTGKTFDSLFIDMGDGMGYRNCAMDTTIMAIYNEGGAKHLKFKIVYSDMSTYHSQVKLHVEDPPNLTSMIFPFDTPDEIHHIFAAEPYEGGYGGGTIYISYACGHTSLQKPFIWAEGYNPIVSEKIKLGLGYEDAWRRINFQDDDMTQSLSEYLQEEGYDLVVLDYDDGGDYLPRTALFIEEAIRFINGKKHENGSDEKNVIIGQSMGGMCSRYALRSMEINEEDHEVATYISFDSGHEGVNIPLGALYLLRQVTSTRLGDNELHEFVPVIGDVVKLVDLPASRTMIKYQPYGIENLGDSYYYNQNHVLGLPQNCEVISIANGSKKGGLGKQDFDSGDLLLHSRESSISIFNALGGLDFFGDSYFLATTSSLIMWQSSWFSFISDLKVWAMPLDNVDPEFIYKGKIITMVLGIPALVLNSSASVSNGTGSDGAPGGLIFPHRIEDFDAIPEGLIPNTYKLGSFCFTPTVSTLNYYGPYGDGFKDAYQDFNSSLTNIQYNYVRDIDNYVANSISEPTIAYADLKNTKHTFFTIESSDFMRYQLVGSDLFEGKTALENDDVYHFGSGKLHYTTMYDYSAPKRTSSNLTSSLLVTDDAKLIVNGSSTARVGLTPSTDYTAPNLPPFTDEDTHFSMEIKNACDSGDPIELIIEDGGELIIGDDDTRTGDVVVFDTHQITVRLGGKVIINKGSELILNYGAKLVIQDGGSLIINDGGTLYTHNGSHVFYNLGAEIQLRGDDAVMHFEGKLVIAPSTEFSPTHEGVSSGRIVAANPDGVLEGGLGSEFHLIGDGDDDAMLTIAEGGRLSANTDMALMRLSNCKVLFRSMEFQPLQSFAPFESINVTYQVQSNLELAGFHPIISLQNTSFISHSFFEDVFVRSEPYVVIDGLAMNIVNSDFSASYNHAVTQLKLKSTNMSMNYCTFSQFTGTALFTEFSPAHSSIFFSTFNGVATNEGQAIEDASTNELRIHNSTFYKGLKGVTEHYGQLSLKCNSFSTYNDWALKGGGYSRLEMSTSQNAGYNVFSNIEIHNVVLDQAQYLSIGNGYNYFYENGNSFETVKGTFMYATPPLLVMSGRKNRWNTLNTVPVSEFDIRHFFTGATIPYNLDSPQNATCSAYNPDIPIFDVPGGGGNYLPIVSVSGGTYILRLDSAVAFAFESTELWDSTANDLSAIQVYRDILMHQYSAQEKGDTLVQFFLNMAYQQMKHTVGHALSTGSIAPSQNQSSFTTPIQSYVDVLNMRGEGDTISLYNYVERFYLELDKAQLLHSLGHTNKGLDILKNVDLCPLDSSEQLAMNYWKFAFEEIVAKRLIGVSAYQKDTVFTDTSSYFQPTTSQSSEYYFGSVINSPTSLTLRNCAQGTKTPETKSKEDDYPFKLYPNPSNGEISIEYDIPIESLNQLVIYSIEGKELNRFDLQGGHQYKNIDISSVESGIYVYQLMVSGAIAKTGRISIVD